MTVPVQLIVNTEDPFVRPHCFDDLSQWVPRLWRRDIKAGHWSPFSHPQVLAASVAELVDFLEGKPASRAMLRAQVGRPRDYFGDTLVSVTGAGSGIGRATALEFARPAPSWSSAMSTRPVQETAAQIAARGGVAHAYTLDVADADAVERFADEVCAEHGVPDIVVNNAGVGQAGRSSTRPPTNRIGCSTSTSVESSTAAGHLARGWSTAAPADMSSTSPRWPRTRRAVAERLLHQQGRGVHVLRLPARRTRRAGIGLTTVCPGVIDTNIVSTTRFDVPPDANDKRRGPARADREGLRRTAVWPREGRQGDRVGGQEEQADPPRGARGLSALRHVALAPQVMRSTARG